MIASFLSIGRYYQAGDPMRERRLDPRTIVLLNPHDERVELLFDDIGEMLNFSLPQHSDVRFWVRDMNTKTWLDATTAFFVVNSELHTPMGTGVAALSSRDAADAVAVAQKGKVVGFEQARANRP